jgi:predicted anti-sigma-YlaC factor YlaD
MTGPHLGDLLSALADGELTRADVLRAEDHLAGCPACRAERDATLRMHELVAGLPLIDPPASVWALMLPSARRRWPVAWAGAAAAAAALVVLSASPSHHRVTPPLATYVQVHAASSGQDPVSGLAPMAIPVSLTP